METLDFPLEWWCGWMGSAGRLNRRQYIGQEEYAFVHHISLCVECVELVVLCLHITILL